MIYRRVRDALQDGITSPGRMVELRRTADLGLALNENEYAHMNNAFNVSYSRVEKLNDDAAVEIFDFDGLWRAFKRQWIVLAICVGLSLAIGAAYKFSAVPLYTSDIGLIIDRVNGQVVTQLSTISTITDDEASVLSQVELIQSDAIVLTVINNLKLDTDPLFMLPKETYLSKLIGKVFSQPDLRELFNQPNLTVEEKANRTSYALRKLKNSIRVERVGRTFVLTLTAVSEDRMLAAKIANAFGEAYLEDKLNSKYDATRRASVWLQERISELRIKTRETDLAVQRFRKDHGLVSAGDRLISEQQLTELNSALILAQGETAQARAKYDRIQRILKSGQDDAIVTDVLASTISNDLRKRYLDASKLETEISNRLGPKHLRAVQLRAEKQEYRRLMFDELGRIAESYKSEVDVALSREKSLSESVGAATGVNAVANETQVQLRELERESDTYKNLYQTFLNRYQEAVQQQSFPITDARVINHALPPKGPAYPRLSMVLAVFFVLGSMIGFAIAALREYSERFFRTANDVRETLGLECFGLLPIVNAKKQVSRGKGAGLGEQKFSLEKTVNSYAADNPFSSFAEVLRMVKFAAENIEGERKQKAIVLGMVSAVPDEGKTTLSINLAQFLASQGERTMLLDFDLRKSGATRILGPSFSAGLIEVVRGEKTIDEVMTREAQTNLGFIPSIVRQRLAHSAEIINSKAIAAIVSELRQTHDFIIVDLPPLAPLVDAREAAKLVDGFVFVTEWGRSSRRAVRSVLEHEPLIMEKCLGVVLNKVDEAKLHLYNPAGSTESYAGRYAKYYWQGN